MGKATTRTGQRSKSIEEVVSYAVGHKTRVQVLTLLNEGIYSPDQLARLIGEPLNRVSHHISELLDGGSIELAKTERVRNTTQHFYRAVEMPMYSDAEVAEMPPQQQQVICGLILQCMMAEAMAAFWAGKMHSDPSICLAWRWYNVDEQGRKEIAEEQNRSWRRVQEIEAESINRVAKSGEDTTSVVVASMGFERERTAPTPPTSPGKR